MGSRLGAIGGILLVYGVVYADDCRKPFRDIGLNPPQIAALKNSRGYQSTRFFEGTVNGQKKTVVLVGEVHTQSGPASESGKGLVDAFPDRSVEGWPGGPLWKGTIRLAYFLDGLSRGKFGGSSLSYAARQAREPGVDHRRLEKDYKPSWKEFAYSWIVPSVYITDRLWWVPSLGAFVSFDIFNPGYALIGPGISLATLLTGTVSKQAIMDRAGEVMNPGRDVHMTGSVLKRLEEANSPAVLMVLVGKDHLHGISQGLATAGFREIFPR